MLEITEKVVNLTYDILRTCAQRGGYINYGVLYDQIGVDRTRADERKRGSIILEKVNNLSIGENDIMITALAYDQSTDMPAEGFFTLAKELGRLSESATTAECIAYWENEKEKIYLIYKKN
jgi:hypothetical protein